MKTLVVRLGGNISDLMPLHVLAVRYVVAARRLGVDRIKLVHEPSGRSLDKSVDQVEQYVKWQGLRLVRDDTPKGDVEIEQHRPMWSVGG